MLKIFTAISLMLVCSQMVVAEEVTYKYSSIIVDEEGFEQTLAELSEEERQRTIAFVSLDWIKSGTQKLPLSNSTIEIPENYYLLLGKDAKKSREMLYGGVINEELEAAIYDSSFTQVITFDCVKCGYIPADDWKGVDAKELLKSISEATENGNKDKVEEDKLHVVGWLQEPTFDKSTNTLYWSFELSNLSGNVVNSYAIKLGLEGYEQLLWITPKESYIAANDTMDVMLKSHKYHKGLDYHDYVEGNKLAGFGMGTFVAAAVAGGILKSGGIALLLKKAAGFVFAGLAFVFYKFRNYFKRNKNDA